MAKLLWSCIAFCYCRNCSECTSFSFRSSTRI